MFRRLFTAMLSIGFVASITLIALTMAVPSNCAAASHPMSVTGFIFDSEGTLIPDIPITINIKDGASIVTTKTATSDSNGEYLRLFLSAEWEIGYTIQVIATGPAGQASNSTIADDSSQFDVDVHFLYAIPELGSDAGVLVTGLGVGVIAVGLLVWRRK